MERYSEYKDSGVQWLGEIPRHWECKRSKYLLCLQNESTRRPNKIGLENIEGFTGKYIQTDSVFDGDGTDFDKGDIVYGKLRPYLCKVWLAEFDGNAVGDFFVYRTSPSFLNFYAKYLMLSQQFTDICNASTYGAKMPRVSNQFISKLLLPLPPLSEQHFIVTYLDSKCSKIDEWINKKQKEVELLGEAKQRIIADAVTRGLNPNVKMKKTGNICMPEVPEHWYVYRYGSLFKLKPFKGHNNEELLSVFLNLGVIKAAESSKRTHAASEDLSKYQLVEETDFVMNNQQAWRGSVGVSKLKGIISPAYHIFLMPDVYDPDYANYLLRDKSVVGQFEMSSRGVGSIQRTLNFNWLNNSLIPVPPLSEQQAIVSYITAKTTKIDSLMSAMNKEIEHLKEYKQRLISDVVTGQIKVC